MNTIENARSSNGDWIAAQIAEQLADDKVKVSSVLSMKDACTFDSDFADHIIGRGKCLKTIRA